MMQKYFTNFFIYWGILFFIGYYFITKIEAGGDMDGLIFFGRKILIVFYGAIFSAALAFVRILLEKTPTKELSIVKKIIFFCIFLISLAAYYFVCKLTVYTYF